MIITDVTNPTYATADGSIINLTLDTVEYGVIEFSANPLDTEELGRNLYAQAIAGEFGPIADYVPPPVVVPEVIDPLQGLLAIDAAGMAGAYEAWANDPARTFAERAFIQRAKFWRRDDPLLNSATAALGMTPAEVDALFVAAAAL